MKDAFKGALKGAIFTVVLSLMMALLFAYLFRLPVPMVGNIGPFGDLSSYKVNIFEVFRSVLMAWLFYGGFLVFPVLGALSGFLADGHFFASDKNNKNKIIFKWCIISAFVPIFLLSISDYIFGPW